MRIARDVVLGLLCLLILVGFLYVVARESALVLVHLLRHFRHGLHHP